MRSAFIYSDRFLDYDYGEGHPLKMVRLRLTYELLKSYEIFGKNNVRIVEPVPASREEVRLIHTEGYISALEKAEAANPLNLDLNLNLLHGLGWGDNPVFRGVYEGSLLGVGGSIMAARMVEMADVDVAFNIAGGLHHAMPDRASGFCYLNDPAIAIKDLTSRGKRVVYIDIDAHHGDGVQHAFYDTDQVLTISLHESGRFLFPGTGDVTETGIGKGKGYSVNLPFLPGTDDHLFVWGFEQVVPPLVKAFKPDFLVTQLGVDTMTSDPLTHLDLTTNGFTRMIELMKVWSIPWVALGGGGYDIVNVARCWSLAFAIMAGVDLPDRLPDEFIASIGKLGLSAKALRDPVRSVRKEMDARHAFAEEGVKYIKEHIFPIHGIKD
ncbi:MAG: acetoin utilization protein AcuC [Nitrospirae bacterium]|nr:acetoin utilization protein AcuC [Nitrospirota bacterium]